MPNGERVTLDTPAYAFIEEGHPLTNPRKERITLRHLLTMTSGIAGEASGILGIPNSRAGGPFEHALGFAPNRYGQWVKTLVSEPGSHWEYSDPAYAHLSILFRRFAGQEIADFMQSRVFGPVGIVACWDPQGGSGFWGPHTNAHTGFHVSARDLARLGYLALKEGAWAGQEIVPSTWVAKVREPSQELNGAYGYGWWTNRTNKYMPGVREDLFALSGYHTSRCYIFPSLDLVVARVGSGPAWADERPLVEGVLGAVL